MAKKKSEEQDLYPSEERGKRFEQLLKLAVQPFDHKKFVEERKKRREAWKKKHNK